MGGVPANSPAGSQSVSELKARIEAERRGEPFLLYSDGSDRQQLFSFGSGVASATMGRSGSSDLVLDWDEQVSRIHARFERAQQDWTVVDDGLSSNGTFVNDERLSGRRRLADGDTVRVGSITMIFRLPQGEEQAVVDLSTTQLRVLVALCRPYKGASAFANPATNQQIADELFLSPDAVRTHLTVLFVKFGLEQTSPSQKRMRLVERGLYSGLISERDL